MDLHISVFLLFGLFTAGHSLRCYRCKNDMGSCADQEVITCPGGSSKCVSVTTVSKVGETKLNDKDCAENCVNGSKNYGTGQESNFCCDTDLCNVQDAPDPSTITTNGKTCYYCDGQNCSKTVNCLGSEDRCYTSWNFNETLFTKGCVSKSFCDYSTASNSTVNGFSCCEGNLCNGFYNIPQSTPQSVTQNITQNVTQSIPQSTPQSVTQNITQNVTQSIPQSTPHSANSAKRVTQSFLLLLIAYLIM